MMKIGRKIGLFLLVALIGVVVIAQPPSLPPVSVTWRPVTAEPDGTLHWPTNFFLANIGDALSNLVEDAFSEYSPTNFYTIQEVDEGFLAVQQNEWEVIVAGLNPTNSFNGTFLPAGNRHWISDGGSLSYYAFEWRSPGWGTSAALPPRPYVTQVWGPGGNPPVTTNTHRLALLSEAQRVNETTAGFTTQFSGFTAAETNLWRLVQGPGAFWRGWEVQGVSLTNDLVVLDEGDYIRYAPFEDTTGMSEVLIESGGHNNNARFEVQISTNNFATWTTNGIFRPAVNQQSGYTLQEVRAQAGVRLVFLGKDIPVPGDTDTVEVYSMTIRRWSIADHVGHTNDAAGVITLVDDAAPGAGRRAVNRRTMEAEQAKLQLQIDNINPELVGVDLDHNPIQYGHRWQQHEDDGTLMLSYQGQPVQWYVNGGTTFPNTVFFSADPTEVKVSVVANASSEPQVQWTTNLVSENWLWVTNYSTTWPTIVNGTATITFPSTDFPQQTFFRVAVTNPVGAASAMHLPHHIELYGKDIRDGVFKGRGMFGELRITNGTHGVYGGSDGAIIIPEHTTLMGTRRSKRIIGTYRSSSSDPFGVASLFVNVNGKWRVEEGSGLAGDLWHTGNFNAANYLTVAGFNNWQTNAMKIIYSAPASNTQHGAVGQVRVDPATDRVYIYAPDGTGTNWMRSPTAWERNW